MSGSSEGYRCKVYNNEICHVHHYIYGVVGTIPFSGHNKGGGIFIAMILFIMIPKWEK